MKNIKTLSRLTALLLAFVMVFCLLVACEEVPVTPDGDNTTDNGGNTGNTGDTGDTGNTGDTGTTPNPPAPKVGVSVTADKSVLNPGETATLTVSVSNTDNKEVTWSVSPAGILAVGEGNIVSIVKDVEINTKVIVTATSVADTNASASKTFIVNPPVIEGQKGQLTSEAIAALGNNSITVTGTVKDIYQNFNDSTYNSTTSYDTFVKMTEGKWVGTWGITGRPSTSVTEYFRKGETDGLKDEYGDIGHQLEMIYIGKNNEMVVTKVMSSKEKSVIWESRHLWNCLEELDVNKFEYDIDSGLYVFQLDWTNPDQEELMREAYLMTYLSYCLTPMMTETLETIMFELDENHNIVKMIAETSKIYTAAGEQIDDASKAETLQYTIFECTFSNIGTTVIEDPKGYDAPENVELLEAALKKLQEATNYTYQIVDRTTQAPSGDSGDYEIMSGTTASQGPSYMADGETAATFPNDYVNKTTGTGTVGSIGRVTADAIVISSTIQYSYSMDGKNFRTEYTGYKNNGNGTYDMFEFDATAGGFVGKRLYTGTFADILPTFELSANIFEWTGMTSIEGKKVYSFTLREDAAARDVALELCISRYANNADASISDGSVTVRVDEDGNLVDVSIAYNSNDIYYGIYTVKYSKIGTTEIVDGAFSNYAPRVLPTSWSAYTDGSYYHLHTTLCTKYGCYNEDTGEYDHSSHTATVDVILNNIFGEEAASIPTPDVFIKVLGDGISQAVSFNYKEGDAEGEWCEFLSFNVTCLDYDTNDNYYMDAINAIEAELNKLGFVMDEANTDLVGGDGRNSSRWATFVKGDIQIVFENIHTKYFYVDIYHTGDWLLSK